MWHTLTHLFIPHQSNNHRAKALHLDSMVVYILAFVFFNLATTTFSNSHPDVLGFATNIQVDRLLSETNAKRAQSGLQPLKLNSQLSQAAAGKAADMFSKNYWAHVAPDGKTPWDFIMGSGYKYSVAGENLAKNFQDSVGVVNAWMASPSHRDNLLKPSYREVGFAVVNGRLLGEETTLVVQMFGTRPNGVAEAAEPEKIETAPAVAQVIPTVEVKQPVVVPEQKPVVIPEVASATQSKPSTPNFFTSFSSVINQPKIDIVKLRRDVSMIFAGAIIGILLVDLYVAMRKKTVRAVGSTVAHVFFFLASIGAMNLVIRGSIL